MNFPKKYRLCDKRAISLVFENAENKVANDCGLFLVRRNNVENHRFVVIVGKKKAKRAVDRNTIKRLIRHAMYDLFRAYDMQALDFVFVARPGIILKHQKSINIHGIKGLCKKLNKAYYITEFAKSSVAVSIHEGCSSPTGSSV